MNDTWIMRWAQVAVDLQCVAVCGSVWQCVAVCGSVLQCAALDHASFLVEEKVSAFSGRE